MGSFIRNTLIFLTGLLFLVSGAILAIALAYPNAIKPAIEAWVVENKQRTLKIKGDLRITLSYPHIGIRANKLELSEHQQDKRFAAIEQVQWTLALQPLLRQQMNVTRVKIHGFDANIIRHQDGRLNIDDLLVQTDESESLNIVIAHTELTAGQVTIHDERTRQRIEFQDIYLTLGRMTPESIEQLAIQIPRVVINQDITQTENQPEIFALQMAIPNIIFDEAGFSSTSITASLDDITSDNRFYTKFSVASSVPSKASDTRAVHMRIQGKLAAQYDQQLLQTHFNVPIIRLPDSQQWRASQFRTYFAYLHPEIFHQPVSGRLNGALNFDQSNEWLQVLLYGVLMESKFHVAGQWRHFEQPDLSVKIKFESVDLDALLATQDLNTRQLVSAQNTGASSNKMELPDWLFIENVNITGSIEIAQLLVGGMRFSGIHFAIDPESRNAH